MEVSRKEALRYLGYGQADADSRILSLLEWAIETLLNCAGLKSVYLQLPCIVHNGIISIGPLKIQSFDLGAHLRGCHSAIVFAATMGPQADILLKRYAHLDMSKAVILQAAAAAIIEGYCNECQAALLRDDHFVGSRFSPGYGDFSLEHQPEILTLLDCPRKIGLTATQSHMLAPTKSVTAIMGISENKIHCQPKGCLECNKTDCAYRRS